MSIVNTKNLVKRYGSNLAVDNLSLNVDKGEIFGLLGPNGAGKSTAIKMIMGLTKPDRGEIVIDSVNIKDDGIDIRKKLGLVPQEIALYNSLSTVENLDYFGRLYGLKGKLLKERMDWALEFVGLSDKRKEIPKKFSGGMKRRLNIACALLHQPEIVIMDEPTVGIDPQSRNHILDSVKKLRDMGTTIIYTSHYMEEVEAICSRVGIMDCGKMIACGTKNELKSGINTNEKLSIKVGNVNFSAINNIKNIEAVKDVSVNDDILDIYIENAGVYLQDVLLVLSNNDIKVYSINIVETDLETVFLSLTGKKLRD